MAGFLQGAIDFMSLRRRAYQLTLGSPAGSRVLLDLAQFCRANETCVVPNDRDKSLVLEGRREVWLRIQQHQHLSTEQLMSLYTGQAINQQQQET